MASAGGRILTFEDWIGSNSLPSRKPLSVPVVPVNIYNITFEKQCFCRENQQIFDRAENELSSLASQSNQEKMDKIFEKIKAEVNKNLEAKKLKVLKEMAQMTSEQQDDVIAFWEGLSPVLTSVFDWMGRMFHKMVDMLRQGWKLVKETTKKFFRSVQEFFDTIL